MRRRFLIPVVMLIVLLFGVSAHATLVDMNDGTVYDTDTQLSWLKNANTAGLNWDAAVVWAADSECRQWLCRVDWLAASGC